MTNRLPSCLLCALLAMAGVLWWQLDSLSDLITYRLDQRPMQTLKTTVKNPAGDLVEVVTEHNGEETAAEQYARHMVMVNIVKAGG